MTLQQNLRLYVFLCVAFLAAAFAPNQAFLDNADNRRPCKFS